MRTEHAFDCDSCLDPVMSNEICVLPSDASEFPDGIVDRKCFVRIMGREPEPDDIDYYDPDNMNPDAQRSEPIKTD